MLFPVPAVTLESKKWREPKLEDEMKSPISHSQYDSATEGSSNELIEKHKNLRIQLFEHIIPNGEVDKLESFLTQVSTNHENVWLLGKTTPIHAAAAMCNTVTMLRTYLIYAFANTKMLDLSPYFS